MVEQNTMHQENQENIYLQRINLVLNHIRERIADDLSLDALAQVACFSPFHFHRIFKSIVGETVNQFVVRLRLERAVALLKTSPRMPITNAAFAVGFESASGFSRAFKKRFGISARTWDRQSPLKSPKDSKIGQVFESFPYYTVDMLSDIDTSQEFTVRLRSLPPQRLAYIRVANSYQPERTVSASERLVMWYCARGGDLVQTTMIGMSQDDPEVTPLELCRYDICITVPEDWVAEGEVSIRDFPACQIAYIHCEGDIYLVDRAWQYLYRYWLPHSRFQPENLPPMEIFHRTPVEIGWEQFDMDAAIAIVEI
jgi:AraC family transcriptional regulator